MGCDIHGFFEVKIEGTWFAYKPIAFRRDYALFGRMAGVRDKTVTPIVAPRGVPEDLSRVARMDFEHMGRDAHTPGWLDAEEIRELYDWHIENLAPHINRWDVDIRDWGYLQGNGWESFRQHPQNYSSAVEDIRMVFWFDS